MHSYTYIYIYYIHVIYIVVDFFCFVLRTNRTVDGWVVWARTSKSLYFPYFILNKYSLLMMGGWVVVCARPSAGSKLYLKYSQYADCAWRGWGGVVPELARHFIS